MQTEWGLLCHLMFTSNDDFTIIANVFVGIDRANDR